MRVVPHCTLHTHTRTHAHTIAAVAPFAGAQQMKEMPAVWLNFVVNFSGVSPGARDLLSRPAMVALGERMVALCPWVAQQIHGDAATRFKTLVHGDFKAMNVFVPRDLTADDTPTQAGTAGTAIPIDFQWSGQGLGMLDVAMHLYHSVEVAAMVGGGEDQLLRHYHTHVVRQLQAATHATPQTATAAQQYTFQVAHRHYELCIVDYARIVLSYFYKNASPEAFAGRANRENCSMVYRTAEAALRFVERVEQCVQRFEQERIVGGSDVS